MNVEIVVSDNFRRAAKRFMKKFHSLKKELILFQESLLENPKQGDKLTEQVYKIRLASKSKGKGKSGGFRIITYLVETAELDNQEIALVVTLLSIYDKSETASISDKEIKLLVEKAVAERQNDTDEELI